VQPAANERLARWDRLFELTSVVPLGAFVVLHVLDYGRVLAGVQEIGARRQPSAFLLLAELVLIWLPLVGHVLGSVPLWVRRRRLERGSATLLAHRIAGVATGVFLVDHFLRFRLPILRGVMHPSDALVRLAAELSSTRGGVPWLAALHLAGVVAVAFHLTIGLQRIAERSERTRASRAVRASCVSTGIVVGAVGVLTVLRLAAGA
jgi:succinate dehydrogenase hydrophobic anchor subunit